MIDALGAPQSLLVLGATSDIAMATVTRLAGLGRLARVTLAGRSSGGLTAEADRVRGLGVGDVRTAIFDAHDAPSAGVVVREAFGSGDVDVVLIAFGVLPDQDRAVNDLPVGLGALEVNFLGAAAAALTAATALERQGHGTLVVLSSVAAERPRAANFVYGSAKAGLDALATGLGDRLTGSGARVIVIRPGFVHTRMTRGLPPPPIASAPDDVAAAIAGNLTGPSRTVWVPRRLRLVMTVLRHLPRRVFRRLPV